MRFADHRRARPLPQRCCRSSFDRGDTIMDKQVWFITGAGRGMGADFAKAVLAAGHALVATGRDPNRLTQMLGPSGDLLAVSLDVTRPEDAEVAVAAAV